MSGRTGKILTVFFFFPIFLFVPVFLPAGTVLTKTDSLRKAIYITDNAEEKIRLYLELSRNYEKINRDSCNFYVQEALSLAKSLNATGSLGEAYSILGNLAIVHNQLDQALRYYTIAARYFQEDKNLERYTKMDQLMGNIFLVKDNLSKAMTYYIEATDLAEKGQYNQILPHLYNNIGVIYFESEDYKTALNYLTMAISAFRKNGDSLDVAYPMVNIGDIYNKLGNLGIATDYYRRAMEIYFRADDDFGISRCNLSLGALASEKGNYPEALELMNKSYIILGQSGTKYLGPKNILLSEIFYRTGSTYLKIENYPLSWRYLHDAYSIARSMSQQKTAMQSAEQLSILFEKQHKTDSAFYYYKIYNLSSDSLTNEVSVRTVKLAKIRQEYDKMQKEDALRMQYEKSTQLTYLILYLISGAALISAIIILILMLRLEKQKKKQSELEKEVLNEKLEFQNKELTTNVMYLTKMNELVVQIAEKLKKIKVDERSSNAKILSEIIYELEHTTGTDVWKEFEIRFQNVHKDFYKNLLEKCPDLTPNELKLCAFLRLNMSTKDISSLTYQSENSLMVARTRLRQKLGIHRQENLISFLAQF